MLGTDCYRIVIQIRLPVHIKGSKYPTYTPIEVTDIHKPGQLNMASYSEPIKATYLGEGTVRLFREFVQEDHELSSKDSSGSVIDSELDIKGDDTMVCIVAMPTYFTATDLLGFIGKSIVDKISHIRILKSEKQNRFLVLIKFETELDAAQFQLNFNGKAFNSMEPETCHTIFVKSVNIDLDVVHGANEDDIPFLLNDPFTTDAKKLFDNNLQAQKLVELPTCPVCLERMDCSVTGLLTIPCQHTFHCQCLSKWKDDSCPICRYSNNISNQKARRSVRRLLMFRRPSMVGNSNTFSPNGDEHCSECNVTQNLWVCLICGNLGCDRYAPQQHSLQHFVSTGHCFAMELDSSRVWDYAGDNYVHRLITNEADGKIVELPDKATNASLSTMGIFEGFGSNSAGPLTFSNPKLASNETSTFDKVEEVGFEYSQLLISQLASQREQYERLLDISKREASAKNVEIDEKMDELTKKLGDLTAVTVPKLEKKIHAKDDKLNKLSHDLNESNKLNDGLSEKVEYLTKENLKLKSDKADLEEQVKDLMFYLETQEKFKDKSEEDKEGTVIMQMPLGSSRSRRTKKK